MRLVQLIAWEMVGLKGVTCSMRRGLNKSAWITHGANSGAACRCLHVSVASDRHQ
jgi:hypothetical protein